jgi:hypothetical protein
MELNVAVTDVAAVIERVHVDVPVQAPDQPANLEPVAGVAVSLTCVPVGKPSVHVAPQLIPAGELVIVPVPVPVLAICTVSWVVVANVAVTETSAVGVTAHVPVPLQAPDQPVNAEPALGVAVSVMGVPLAKLALHVVPQLIPAGSLVTVPVPLPESCTVS